MPVGTPEKYYENEEDFWHERAFGPKPKNAGGEGKMFMVRHGDTNCNDDGEVHGWVDEPLNEEGVKQAHKAAESLKDKEITRIVSSDLPRAKQTANILAKHLGVPVQFDPNLRTWDAGDFDYTTKHKEFEKYTQPVEASRPQGMLKDNDPRLHADERYSIEDINKAINEPLDQKMENQHENIEAMRKFDEKWGKYTADQIRRNKKFDMEDMPIHFPNLSVKSQRDI